MCGRFALVHKVQDLEAFFGVAGLEAFPPRYNIAPTQPILVVTASLPRNAGSNLPDREIQLMRWGLIPSWVKDIKDFPLLINARSETASAKPSFRNAMRHRRAIIPASGFYEWQRDAQSGDSQAYWIKPKRGGVVGFAALCETYMSANGSEMETVAFLTGAANGEFMPIHHRMPIMLDQTDFARWLDCRTQEPRHIQDLLKSPEQGVFEAVPISDRVNKVANNEPQIQERVKIKMVDKRPEVKTSEGRDGQFSLF